MSSNAENFYVFLGTLIGLALAVLLFLKFYVQRSMNRIERKGENPSENKSD